MTIAQRYLARRHRDDADGEVVEDRRIPVDVAVEVDVDLERIGTERVGEHRQDQRLPLRIAERVAARIDDVVRHRGVRRERAHAAADEPEVVTGDGP